MIEVFRKLPPQPYSFLLNFAVSIIKVRKPNPIKLIKRISREAFMEADVRSKPYKNAKKYSRKEKHKKIVID